MLLIANRRHIISISFSAPVFQHVTSVRFNLCCTFKIFVWLTVVTTQQQHCFVPGPHKNLLHLLLITVSFLWCSWFLCTNFSASFWLISLLLIMRKIHNTNAMGGKRRQTLDIISVNKRDCSEFFQDATFSIYSRYISSTQWRPINVCKCVLMLNLVGEGRVCLGAFWFQILQ